MYVCIYIYIYTHTHIYIDVCVYVKHEIETYVQQIIIRLECQNIG